jgi:alpha-tubulin suppressor-like RCC1 family protein
MKIRLKYLWSLLAALPLVGCVHAKTFDCASNAECLDGNGAQGVCEANGSCSFPDDSCDGSRRRYTEDASGATASQCVGMPATSCVTQLAGGEAHFCMLQSSGSVWCWGDNEHGQLGDDTTENALAPVPLKVPADMKVVGIYPGEVQTCLLDGKGVVHCWGSNEDAALGFANGWSTDEAGNDVPSFDEGDVLTPEAVSEVLEPDAAGVFHRQPAPVFEQLAVGGVHACALTAAGAMYCWGENNHAQCGVDPAVFGAETLPVPVRVAGVPKSVKAMALGDEFSLLLTQDGSVFAFGDNSYGELGTGKLGGESPEPVQVGITAVRELAPGAAHACAEKEDGTIWCWGYGASGALGLGDTRNQASPQYVTAARSIASSGNAFHTCAIDVNLGLECWGQNAAGAIGTGEVSDGQATWIATPSVVPIATVMSVATSNSATCALTTDSVLWCWGENSAGQLGAGSAVSTSVPTPEPVRASFSCD